MPQPPALYIGRFQPFHLGHLDALGQIFAREKKVIIAIGSSQQSGTTHNPFSALVRKKMIRAVLKSEKIAGRVRQPPEYKIFFVPDINDDARWASHVEKLLPKFGSVYTGSAHTAKLFKLTGTHKVVRLKFNKKISGTRIRTLLRKKGGWQRDVPSGVLALLQDYQYNQ